jgi:hypothetical protein
MLSGASPRQAQQQAALAWMRPSQRPENRLWTVEEVRERLADAGDTLRRLPKPPGLERSLQAAWPDILRDWLAYGWDKTQVKRAAPTPQAITRLDESLAWMHLLSPSQRMVLWAREAERMSWRRISYCDHAMGHGKGRGIRQLQNIKGDAEHRILSRLNGTPGRMRLPFPGGDS